MLLNTDLVIGGSLESLYYSLCIDGYHLCPPNNEHFFFETIDLPVFGEVNKRSIWKKTKFFAAMMGRSIPASNSEKIEILGDLCKVSGRGHSKSYRFKHCYIFGSPNIVLENEIISSSESIYRVVDDLEVRNISRETREIDPVIDDRGAFANKIFFYTSNRIDGAKHVTDCVVESFLTKDQLLDINFSDVASKFAVQKTLAKLGILGRPQGKLKSGEPKYLKPEATHVRRIIAELPQVKYKDSEQVTFLDLKMEDIIFE